jgi:flagellar hook-associated protein 3 FlgL
MITRVTNKMQFNAINYSLASIQSQYDSLMEKLASEKRINRPSDDPLGMGRVLDSRLKLSNISQYRDNTAYSTSWVTLAESSLNGVNDALTEAKTLAVAQATATSSASSRQIAAASVEQIIDQVLSLANAMSGDRYIFSGSKNTAPFSETAHAASIAAPVQATGNEFDGHAASSGTYAGTENKTYVVKIISGGALGTATYVVSDEGGKDGTWGTVQTGLSGAVNIGEGINVTFTDDGTTQLAAGDIFSIDAKSAGYYNGNSDRQSVEIGKGLTIEYGITGQEIFTALGSKSADIFQTLNDLKTSLESNDTGGIQAQIENLNDALSQVNLARAKCGTISNSLEINGNNLDQLETGITELLSSTEDADVAALITEYKMKELALQATYSMAAEIGQNSILNFID